MKKLLLLLLLSVSPVLAQNASPFCTKMTTRVHVKTRPGNPQYISQYSRDEFLQKAGSDFSPYTLGLTVSKLDVTIEAKPSLSQKEKEICVGLQDVDIEIKYPSITVYIDKKYPVSSCEYQIIKEHEDYHVAVAQQALAFFKPDIESIVYNTLQKMSPKIVYSKNDITAALQRHVKTLKNELQPVINHINKKLYQKNRAIDTEKMYKETTALCNHW